MKVSSHNGSTFDQRHYRFERTISGFYPERDESRGDRLVAVVSILLLVALLAGAL